MLQADVPYPGRCHLILPLHHLGALSSSDPINQEALPIGMWKILCGLFFFLFYRYFHTR